MTIETRYNQGDVVYALNNGNICVFKITYVSARQCSVGLVIEYYLTNTALDPSCKSYSPSNQYTEDTLYATKKEAVDVWLRKQNMEVGLNETSI